MLEMHSKKATAVSKSNNAGVWGRSSQPPEANDGFGDSDFCFDFTAFLKTHSFKHFWSKFLLKATFLMVKLSVLMCPQGLRPEARVLNYLLSPLLTPLSR